jgi:hypothetical protein
MRKARQIEACKLMVSASNCSSSYTKALLAATPDEERVRPEKRGIPAVVTSADLALMERELQGIQKNLKTVEGLYGQDMLDLVIAARYVSRLLDVVEKCPAVVGVAIEEGSWAYSCPGVAAWRISRPDRRVGYAIDAYTPPVGGPRRRSAIVLRFCTMPAR